jgi:hypothetical protein
MKISFASLIFIVAVPLHASAEQSFGFSETCLGVNQCIGANECPDNIFEFQFVTIPANAQSLDDFDEAVIMPDGSIIQVLGTENGSSYAWSHEDTSYALVYFFSDSFGAEDTPEFSLIVGGLNARAVETQYYIGYCEDGF